MPVSILTVVNVVRDFNRIRIVEKRIQPCCVVASYIPASALHSDCVITDQFLVSEIPEVLKSLVIITRQ